MATNISREKSDNGKNTARPKGIKVKSDNNKTGNVNQKDNSLLHEFFIDSLKDMYWAEKNLLKALTKLQKKATGNELRSAFEHHKSQTEEHVARIEQAFNLAGKKAQAQKCEAMAGIMKEAESIIEETKDDTFTRDAALIIAAQKAEHYEIASYGGIVTLAKTLGHQNIADLLYKTLEEEKQTDLKLTEIAESSINEEASNEEEES